MKSIRDYYGVPAKRGAYILFRDDLCVITGSSGAYLRARGIFNYRKYLLHPTWNVEYIIDNGKKSVKKEFPCPVFVA
jgi:hypothetical protein